MANKLPEFCKSGSVDSTIVNNTSALSDTGFVSGTTIRSDQVNTYIKMCCNALKGIADALSDGNDISAASTSSAWSSRISEGIKVSSVAKATTATNVADITPDTDTDYMTVKFSIGDKSYEKTLSSIGSSFSSSIAASTESIISKDDSKWPWLRVVTFNFTKSDGTVINFGMGECYSRSVTSSTGICFSGSDGSQLYTLRLWQEYVVGTGTVIKASVKAVSSSIAYIAGTLKWTIIL